MKVVAVVQARAGSSRLPGKVLRRIGGRAMLTHVLARAKAVHSVVEVVLSTTPDHEDDAVVSLARGAGVRSSRGQVPLAGRRGRNDVLAGYVMAARLVDADVVVRLTSDCPLLDPAVAQLVLDAFLAARACRYASNVCPPSWYDGCDVEVISREALELAAAQARCDEREHVTTWLRDSGNAAVVGETVNVAAPGGDWSALKLSVDTAADLERVRRVHAHLSDRELFGWADVLEAYHAAYPAPAELRALRIFGRHPAAAAARTAYVEGVCAAASGVPTRCPYSTDEHARATAWAMGWEDVVDLGHFTGVAR